jgi:hypothetical protein
VEHPGLNHGAEKVRVSFTGFYGHYSLTTAGKTFTFPLVKGAQGSPVLTFQQ